MIRINYGVSKREGRKILTKNDHLFLSRMDYDKPEDHAKVRQLIYDKHPGWRIVGYCLAGEVKL